MKINDSKIKVMIITRDTHNINISIDGKLIEQAEALFYIGQILIEDTRCETEISSKIVVAKETFRDK